MHRERSSTLFLALLAGLFAPACELVDEEGSGRAVDLTSNDLWGDSALFWPGDPPMLRRCNGAVAQEWDDHVRP